MSDNNSTPNGTNGKAPRPEPAALKEFLAYFYNQQSKYETEQRDGAILALAIAKNAVQAVLAWPGARKHFDIEDLKLADCWLLMAINRLVSESAADNVSTLLEDKARIFEAGLLSALNEVIDDRNRRG